MSSAKCDWQKHVHDPPPPPPNEAAAEYANGQSCLYVQLAPAWTAYLPIMACKLHKVCVADAGRHARDVNGVVACGEDTGIDLGSRSGLQKQHLIACRCHQPKVCRTKSDTTILTPTARQSEYRFGSHRFAIGLAITVLQCDAVQQDLAHWCRRAGYSSRSTVPYVLSFGQLQ